jgi:FixJ family two-component response regulator
MREKQEALKESAYKLFKLLQSEQEKNQYTIGECLECLTISEIIIKDEIVRDMLYKSISISLEKMKCSQS